MLKLHYTAIMGQRYSTTTE